MQFQRPSLPEGRGAAEKADAQHKAISMQLRSQPVGLFDPE